TGVFARRCVLSLTTEARGTEWMCHTWQGMKLCRPYRAECFIRGLIPGAAPDGLPQAIELSCAFSADLPACPGRLVGAPASSPARCSCDSARNRRKAVFVPWFDSSVAL